MSPGAVVRSWAWVAVALLAGPSCRQEAAPRRAVGAVRSAPPAGCPTPVETLVLPAESPYRRDGRTSGESRVASASCRRDATGPEAVYTLDVRRPTGVRFSTDEGEGTVFDTVLSVRRTCDDARTELACDDDGGRRVRSVIRTFLEPGTYALIVDGFQRQAGAYHLEVSTYPASAHALCERALPLAPGQPVRDESTVGGGPRSDQCRYIGEAGSTEGGQLFYALRVPGRQRARVEVRPTGSARWTPVVRALNSCRAVNCVEITRAPAEGRDAVLTFANASDAPHTYLVSVSPYTDGTGGTFDLQATVAP